MNEQHDENTAQTDATQTEAVEQTSDHTAPADTGTIDGE